MLVVKVSSNPVENEQSRHQKYLDPRQCNDTALCLRTSGCELLNIQRTRTTTQSSLMPFPIRYTLEHVRGLVIEFRRTLLNYVSTVLEAQTVWEEDGLSVPVHQRGLQNLYPLSSDTETLTGSLPEDKHRVLRESRWLLTSVEAHVQLLHAVNAIRAGTGRTLDRKMRRVSNDFRLLLVTFSVGDLPEQANCVQSSSELTVSETKRAQFTSMALRDVHRALLRVYEVLSSCEVHVHNTGLHLVKLRCESPQTSAFYQSVPENITFLYHPSRLLAP